MPYLATSISVTTKDAYLLIIFGADPILPSHPENGTVALRTNVLSPDLPRWRELRLSLRSTYTLAFSRLLYPEEVLIAYNVSGNPRNDCVIVDSLLHLDGTNMRFLYGGTGNVPVQTAPHGSRLVRLQLPGYGFAILA